MHNVKHLHFKLLFHLQVQLKLKNPTNSIMYILTDNLSKANKYNNFC